MTRDKPFIWQGGEIVTIGDLGDACAALKTEEEGRVFFDAYLAVNVHAAANIGYVAGYYGFETASRIWRLTGTAHPVFGVNYVEPGVAFETGRRMASEPKP